MHFRSLLLKHNLAGLAAGLMMVSTTALAEDDCGDFQPLSGNIVDMTLVDHTNYANPGLGASISYAGDDGILTYYRYDLGFNNISNRTLMLATERSVEELGTVLRLLSGDVVRIRQSGTTRMINEVDVKDVVIIAQHPGGSIVNVIGMGSDGRCLHKIHYTPTMSGVGEDGRNQEGLLAFERFERVLDEMSVYFCRYTCVTEM